MRAVMLLLVLLLSCVQSADVIIRVGATNTVSFSPTSVTINPGDTVTFEFQRAGDRVVSGANLLTVCPDGVNPSPGTCAEATSPLINITGPLSGQSPFNATVLFPTLGVFSVVNPTYCQTLPGFETVACSAKAVITVSNPAPTPSPGSTIVVIGQGGAQVAFPSPLVVTVGDTVWFRFDVLAGVVETDANGVPVLGGLSCPTALTVGSFCSWNISSQKVYNYRATPFSFGGIIDAQPPVAIPPGAFVIGVGQNGNSFTVPAGTVPVGSLIYFSFATYGPYRVQRADGPNCQPFIGSGSFDSRFQAAGRVFAAGIVTQGLTYFFDTTFCSSNNMIGQVLGTGGSNGSQFVEVIVAPRNNATGASELIYSPSPAIVFQGGSVRWTFTDFGHTVTQALNNDASTCLPDPTGFNSGFVQPPVNGIGGFFQVQFNTIGTFNYFCSAHCALGMRGSVIVVPRPENIITHGVNSTVNPNQFNPPVLVTFVNETVCWDFITAGDIVEADFYQDCTAKVGGFNSGQQPVGTRICRNFTGPSCTAFYFFDSAQCQNGMYGVVLLSDMPAVTVSTNNPASIFTPLVLNVTVGSTVTWSFAQAGNSVTQALSPSQFSSTDTAVRCAVQPGGFNSGVVQQAGSTFSFAATTVGTYGVFSTPFCPFPATFPGFFSTLNVCNPIVTRTVTPTTTTSQTTTPAPPTDGPSCNSTDPCAKPVPRKTVINFYFADILAGARCNNCSTNTTA